MHNSIHSEQKCTKVRLPRTNSSTFQHAGEDSKRTSEARQTIHLQLAVQAGPPCGRGASAKGQRRAGFRFCRKRRPAYSYSFRTSQKLEASRRSDSLELEKIDRWYQLIFIADSVLCRCTVYTVRSIAMSVFPDAALRILAPTSFAALY